MHKPSIVECNGIMLIIIIPIYIAFKITILFKSAVHFNKKYNTNLMVQSHLTYASLKKPDLGFEHLD